MKTKKGQIAIEYIIFISVLLLFFQAIVYPNIIFSERVVEDIYQVTQTKQSIEKLSHDIESFSASSGFGKRTVYFYLPNKAKIDECDGQTIKFEVILSAQNPRPSLKNCVHDTTNNIVVCKFERKLLIDSNLACIPIGPGFNSYLVIEKFETGDLNVSLSN